MEWLHWIPLVARPENETYTVKVSSDDYADVSVQLVYGTIAFKEKSGTLYIGSSRQLEATGENCKDKENNNHQGDSYFKGKDHLQKQQYKNCNGKQQGCCQRCEKRKSCYLCKQ